LEIRPHASWKFAIANLRAKILFCVLCVVCPTLVPAQTPTIHIRLVDGRTGKNLSGMNLQLVDYHTDRNGGKHSDLNGRMTVTASVDGDSYVASPDAHGILVFGGMGNGGDWIPCTRQKLYDPTTRTYGNDNLYPVTDITASGLVAKNTCSKITAAAKPGELIIFLRHSTWWERFVWGLAS
jgi:hypothetical protein